MHSINSVLVEGNLTADPVSKTLSSGTPMTTFSIASERFYKSSPDESYTKEVSFFDVETWGRLADHCAPILSKGSGVRVVGRLKQDRWVDADGKMHSRVKIVAEHIEIRPDFKERHRAEERDAAEAAADENIADPFGD